MEDPKIIAREARLKYISDLETPGYTRKKTGNTFRYLDQKNKIIRNNEFVKRFEDLKIPPAWTKVWISPSAHTHLQVTGLDDRGRKQYIYHPEWVALCQQKKFDKLVAFAESLPKIRRRIQDDLKISGLAIERILATVIWLLDHTFIRIGNEQYVRENNSYGLTTLHQKHVDISGEHVHFEFIGKKGIKHSYDIKHPRVARTIKRCIELPGYEVFKYIDDNGNQHSIDSEQVNNYLKNLTGEDITAKDYRVWGGTTLAADVLFRMDKPVKETDIRKNLTATAKLVASLLQNTPTVARSYYIHPTVFHSYEQNKLVKHLQAALANSDKKDPSLKVMEFGVLMLLKKFPLEKSNGLTHRRVISLSGVKRVIYFGSGRIAKVKGA